jgi:hypothetical protein
MLNLINPDAVTDHNILNLVKEYRRSQISRFPIDVKFQSRLAGFLDSRLGDKEKKPLASLWYDVGDGVYVLQSRLIKNERYASHNSKYKQKRSKDPKKLLKPMKDFIKPYTAAEIAAFTSSDMEGAVYQWTMDGYSQMREILTLERGDIIEEVVRMRDMGYQPHTQKFAKIMAEGVPAYEEHQRRRNRAVMRVHVMFNPDNSLEIFCDDKMGYGGISEGTTTYTTLDEAPLSIRQQIAMLRMTEPGTFVPEVGHKIDPTTYWVEIHPK